MAGTQDPKFVFDYFYGDESLRFSFYRIPKVMFTDEPFKSLPTDAKMLYGLLLDRTSLSLAPENRWLDQYNRCYVIYTTESIMADLGCASEKAAKLLRILQEAGLVTKQKRGLGKPDIIYVHNFAAVIPVVRTDTEDQTPEQPAAKDGESGLQNFDFRISGASKSESPDVRKSDLCTFGNQTAADSENESLAVRKTNRNNTDINHTEKEQDQSYRSADAMEQYIRMIRENVEYDRALVTYSREDMELFDELCDLICDIVCVKRDTVKINHMEYPYELVKNRFLRLRYSHLEYVLYSMKVNVSRILNIRQYLLTALYNSLSTISHYYQSSVNSHFCDDDL